MFDLDRAFVNTNVNEKVFILNKTILNILSSFIPQETLTVDDKEPPWFIKKIKNLIQEKNNVCKSYLSSRNTLDFSSNNIEKIIQNLDPNKDHGHDKISIRMIKICGKLICKPLQLLFNQCIDTSSFPLEWKKANIVPIHKKGDKQCLKKLPTSLIASNS